MIFASGPPISFQLVTLPVKICLELRHGDLRQRVRFVHVNGEAVAARRHLDAGVVVAIAQLLLLRVGFIERDDSQMSVVPLMSALMPVPEPPPVTCMIVFGFFFMYSSAQRWPRMTIVSEPLTVMRPGVRGKAGSHSDRRDRPALRGQML